MAASRKLKQYRAKRDFKRTAEPSGEQRVAASKRLRFVIQKHAARRLHFDLRLELGGVFKSWAVTKMPSYDPQDKRLAVEVEDHPLDYGDFEGTIPKGQYGGGTVQLWDRGYWKPEGTRSPQAQLKAGELKFTLDGTRLKGSWVLVLMRNDRYGNGKNNWLLIKHRQNIQPTKRELQFLLADKSVASGRSTDEITAGRKPGPKPFMRAGRKTAKPDAVWQSNREPDESTRWRVAVKPKRRRAKIKPPPKFIKLQLYKRVDHPPQGDHWAHEIKFDGQRMQLRVENGAAQWRTPKGVDWTRKFAALTSAASTLPDCIIDGEIVAVDKKGLVDAKALKRAITTQATDALVFYAFDLLFHDGKDIRKQTLNRRKELLKAVIERNAEEHIRYSAHFETGGDVVLQSACRMHLRGIVSKRLDRPYHSGRNADWTEAQCPG